MSICTYYRGRLSFTELMNMPMEYIHTFEYLIYQHRNDHKDMKEAEALEDTFEEIM